MDLSKAVAEIGKVRFYVKNTFINVEPPLEEELPVDPLQRNATAPPTVGKVADLLGDDTEDEGTPEKERDPTIQPLPEEPIEPKIFEVISSEDQDYWRNLFNGQAPPQMDPSTMAVQWIQVPTEPSQFPGPTETSYAGTFLGMAPPDNVPLDCYLMPVGQCPLPDAPTPQPSLTLENPQSNSGYSAPSPPLPTPNPPALALVENSELKGERTILFIPMSRLKSNDRVFVSDAYFHVGGERVLFKIMIHPRTEGGFKKAKAECKIELKCEKLFAPGVKATGSFTISVTSCDPRETEKMQAPRGPVEHDFASNGVAKLPPGEEYWDFLKSVDNDRRGIHIHVSWLIK